VLDLSQKSEANKLWERRKENRKCHTLAREQHLWLHKQKGMM